jgi:hypothetical protein
VGSGGHACTHVGATRCGMRRAARVVCTRISMSSDMGAAFVCVLGHHKRIEARAEESHACVLAPGPHQRGDARRCSWSIGRRPPPDQRTRLRRVSR